MLIDEAVSIETKEPYLGKLWIVLFTRVGEFKFDDASNMRMEQHPFALSLINSIVKGALKSSKLV